MPELPLPLRPPANANYGELVYWHLQTNGTRPGGQPGIRGLRWEIEQFAHSIDITSRVIRKWHAGEPPSIASQNLVEGALFGDNPLYAEWREQLRAAATRPVVPEPAPPPAAPPAENLALPTRPDRNFGRESLADTLATECLAEPPPRILVLGGAGFGKTTLTNAVATHRLVAQKFGQRRWFVGLETATEARGIVVAIAVALGLDTAGGLAPVLARLGEAPGLLVLDNLETPWEAEEHPTAAILRQLAAVPGLVLLASLRGTEQPGGARWRLVPLGPLADDDAARLFRDFAHNVRPDDPNLQNFIAALGGVPLALELVAKRVGARDTLAESWAEWQRLGTTLAARLRDGRVRNDSLARSIDFSWDSPRLGPAGRRLFALLGQLPAGIAAEDCRALLAGDAERAESELLAVGLAHHRDGRIDLLPPIRDHAARRHPPAADDQTCWIGHYLGLAHREGRKVGAEGGREAVARLLPEAANLESAMLAAREGPDRAVAVVATYGFADFVRFTGAGSATPLRALAIACHAADDPLGEANCIRSLGDIALRRSDHAAARAAYEEALPLYRRVGDVLGEANCIRSLGDIALARSDHAAARAAYEEALPLYRRVGAVLGEANCIQSLGDIARDRSDHAAARAAYEEALPLYRRVGDVLGEANCIQRLGDIDAELGDPAARDRFGAALRLYERIPEPYSIGFTHRRLAILAAGPERVQHLAAARAAWASIDRPDLIAQYLDPLEPPPKQD